LVAPGVEVQDTYASAAEKLAERWTLKGKGETERRECLQKFADAYPELKVQVEMLILEWKDVGPREYDLRADCVLLTWQGEWGDAGKLSLADVRSLEVRGGSESCARPPFIDADAATASSPGRCGSPEDLELLRQLDPDSDLNRTKAVAAWAERQPRTRELVADLRTHIEDWRAQLNVKMAAWSLEMCPRTFKETGQVKIHIHCFFSFDSRRRMAVAKLFTFKGSLPFASQSLTQFGFARSRNKASGLYDLQSPKASVICSDGTHTPFVDYGVNHTWVFSAVQSGKMAFADGRRELCRIPVQIGKT
jgi:hypothetical protein